MLKKTVLNILGGLLVLSGCVWMGQGAGFLPGKLMRGDPQWILWGALLALAGGSLLYLANRRRA